MSPTTYAFYKATPTIVEWDALPDICKDPLRIGIEPPEGRAAIKHNSKQRGFATANGIWHTCHGFIWLHRLELNSYPKKRDIFQRNALGELGYTLRGLLPGSADEKFPFVAEWLVAHARALFQAKEYKKAIKQLDRARGLFPSYYPLYTVHATIHFNEDQTGLGIEILEEGIKATGDPVGELNYHLGLAYFKAGEIAKARTHEKVARERKYPFRFLTRKLAELDAKK